ncbi:hypothetical protein LIER_13497 [Lithospermum erythrorhizon]|uniref:Integrase catalytic domain-containing protein n=1 Tax=Lithospermum erythrorhizon TaxID=34254 RepID=A0AAV3PVM4_LITER
MVEQETNESLKCIRTDNGGEYIGEFDQYCKIHGMLHEQSVPKTPQHNGLAERMNRTIVEKVRCLLSHSNLPTTFWMEALFVTIQIINLSPTTILEGVVLEKVWSRNKVSYKHLRVYGCRIFVHVPKNERSKLDNISRQCVYLSYGDDKFGYKLYDPVMKKVVRSRDVVFFEDQSIKDFDKEAQIDLGDRGLVELDSDDEDETTSTPNMSNGAAELGVGNNIVVDDVIEEDRSKEEFHVFEQVARDLSSVERVETRPAVRVSTRAQVPSSRYMVAPHEYVLFTDEGEPICYQEAIQVEDKLEWISAMEDEINSLMKNKTYILVDRVPNQKVLKNRDRKQRMLWLSQEKYILKVLARFNMESSKPISCLLGAHFKLSSKLSPEKKYDDKHMKNVAYASVMGNLMYAIIYTRLDLAYSIGLFSRFLSRPGKEHWEAVKWVFRYLKGT